MSNLQESVSTLSDDPDRPMALGMIIEYLLTFQGQSASNDSERIKSKPRRECAWVLKEYWLSLLEGQTIMPSLEQGEAFQACYVLLKALSREKSDTTWSNELERRLDDMSTYDKALLSYTCLVQTMIEESLGRDYDWMDQPIQGDSANCANSAQLKDQAPGQINDTSTARSREDIESENDSDDSDVTVKAAEPMKGDRQESP
ncbi:hypothetical protein M231_03952 [Tremella mesenterica]|uniref:Uncharacterized protein n=1 Tax=Tremella mesenterica TaxID=5217 RepID=A0A4Q1BLV8_TREME|nr:hypothetical protein M231_03952 [Tremella mesenterica]